MGVRWIKLLGRGGGKVTEFSSYIVHIVIIVGGGTDELIWRRVDKKKISALPNY